MKSRTLVMLVVTFAAMAGLVLLQNRGNTKPAAGPKSGDRLLAIEDFNKVAGLTFVDGTQSLDLVKSGGKWVIAGLFNYPANFDRVADELNKYDQLRIGQLMPGGDKALREYGLDPAATGEGVVKPAVVKFRDEAGKELGSLTIGADRSRPSGNAAGGSFPDSQYVRVGEGPVVLVDTYLGRPGLRGHDWIETQLLSIQADDVVEVDLKDRDGKTYGLLRGSNGTYLAKAKATNEEVKAEGASALFGAIGWLSMADVAGPAASVTGAFSGATAQYRAKTKDGLVYTLDIGATNGAQRYAKLAVTFEAPPVPPEALLSNGVPAVVPAELANTNALPAPTNANMIAVSHMKIYQTRTEQNRKIAESQQAKHQPWVYLLDEGSTQNLTMPREQAIAVPVPQTNATPAAAGAPFTMPTGGGPSFGIPGVGP